MISNEYRGSPLGISSSFLGSTHEDEHELVGTGDGRAEEGSHTVL